jgi:hypothetical protein
MGHSSPSKPAAPKMMQVFMGSHLSFVVQAHCGLQCASVCRKGLAEFAASAAKKVELIFCRGVYLTENTSQAASVEFVCLRQTNYARSRLQNTVGKGRRPFSTV